MTEERIIVKSKRNNEEAFLINQNEESVTLEMLNSKEQKIISVSTFKRWWKEEKHETIEEPKIEEIVKEVPEEIKTEIKAEEFTVGNTLKVFIEEYAISKGCEVGDYNINKFRYIKLNGNLISSFNFSSKGITLWLRSEVVKSIIKSGDKIPNIIIKEVNHLFNLRVKFDDDTRDSTSLIEELMDLSVDHMLRKQEAKNK